MVVLFGQGFVEQAEERGAAWHLRRLDRRSFRAVLDELGSIPAHGRDRQRYCRIVVQDDPPLAGCVCLFLLDPEAWNDAALDAQMRSLPAKRRRRRAAPKKQAPESTDADASQADSEAEEAPTAAPGDIKPVRKRRFQQRLEARRRRRKGPDKD